MTILNANEYITKGDVMQILQKAYTDGRIQAKDGCASVLDDIAAIKADVQPVKRGRWDFQGYQLFKCTNCAKIYTQEQLEDIGENWTFPNFCPNCGARMN